jgi:Sugar-specific transcriptional regulator TrmB
MTVDLLQQIGLNKYEAEAYFALLAIGPLTGYELGKRSAVPLSKSYEILERLTRRGLALVQPGDPPRYAAERPERFLARTRADQESVLTALASALDGVQRADPADDFWVVRGRANVLARACALIGDARRSVAIGLSGGDDVLLDALDSARVRGRQVTARHLDDPWQASAGAPAPPELIVLLADDRESLVGTLSSAAHCQAVSTASPALALAVRGALEPREASRFDASIHRSEAAGADAERGLDWLDWEARKHQRLRRSQQGGRVA